MLFRDTSIRPRNFILGSLLVIICCGLFFMPEVARLFSNKKSAVPAANRVVKVETQKSKDVINAGTPLDRVLSKLQDPHENEVKENPAASTKSKKKGIFDGVFSNKGDKNKDSQTLRAKTSAKRKNAQIEDARNMTWPQLMSKESLIIMQDGLKECRSIHKKLDQTKPNSARALVLYIKALDKFINGGYRNVPPNDALFYLGNLDMEVTKNFAAEKVSRTVYRQWLETGLDPFLQGTGAIDIKRQFFPRFTADIIITDLKAIDRIKRTRYGNRLVRDSSSINIYGAVLGSDTLTLEVFRGVTKIKEQKIRKRKDLNAPVKFSFRYGGKGQTNNLSGPFILRVKDDLGNYFQKTYKFDPLIRRFPQTRSGVFSVPKLNYSLINIDRRIDKYFLYSVGGTDIIVSPSSGGFDSLNDTIDGFSSF